MLLVEVLLVAGQVVLQQPHLVEVPNEQLLLVAPRLRGDRSFESAIDHRRGLLVDAVHIGLHHVAENGPRHCLSGDPLEFGGTAYASDEFRELCLAGCGLHVVAHAQVEELAFLEEVLDGGLGAVRGVVLAMSGEGLFQIATCHLLVGFLQFGAGDEPGECGQVVVEVAPGVLVLLDLDQRGDLAQHLHLAQGGLVQGAGAYQHQVRTEEGGQGQHLQGQALVLVASLQHGLAVDHQHLAFLLAAGLVLERDLDGLGPDPDTLRRVVCLETTLRPQDLVRQEGLTGLRRTDYTDDSHWV